VEKALKIYGIRAAASMTRNWNLAHGYVQISYNVKDDAVYAEYHAGNPSTNWSTYKSRDVIQVINARAPMTMTEIKDYVRDAVQLYELDQTRTEVHA